MSCGVMFVAYLAIWTEEKKENLVGGDFVLGLILLFKH